MIRTGKPYSMIKLVHELKEWMKQDPDRNHEILLLAQNLPFDSVLFIDIPVPGPIKEYLKNKLSDRVVFSMDEFHQYLSRRSPNAYRRVG